ncbi:hypothetical protein NL108_014846 [Boleophthalmus pectinirostris]|nr:hypothetical protein NL108_014846 [Boleophthalmus pectinirostris]
MTELSKKIYYSCHEILQDCAYVTRSTPTDTQYRLMGLYGPSLLRQARSDTDGGHGSEVKGQLGEFFYFGFASSQVCRKEKKNKTQNQRILNDVANWELFPLRP